MPEVTEYDDATRKLTELVELTSYEAMIYVTLVKLGGAHASELVTRTGVPRTRIYSTLDRLCIIGMVTKSKANPVTYTPVAPKEILGPKLTEVRANADNLEGVVNFLDEKFRTSREKGPIQMKHLWQLMDKRTVTRHLKTMIVKAEKKIDVFSCPDGLSYLFRYFSDVMVRKGSSGVKTTIYTPLDPEEDTMARELNYDFDVRHRRVESPVMFLGVDDQSFLIVNFKSGGEDVDPALDQVILGVDSTLYTIVTSLISA
ncbi:MAG TPA: helix-turn-helix domain-containing protein [Patescibacteria group bacterium]|nr:helix-turn-helix domain-containing protein [Patescibacteria group bacterium]